MLNPPSFLLPRPPMPADPATLAAFDALFDRAVAQGTGSLIDYDLINPRWQFLCHLADNREIVLHGSANPNIALFEPRKSNDVNPFGDRNAVYAASDGIWPMYFAILNRQNHPMSLINSSMRVELGPDGRSDPFYFFSITKSALEKKPFQQGTVYLLPRETFEQQAGIRYKDWDIYLPQWASMVPVAPLAKLTVGPDDFPFLSQMRGHDDKIVFERAAADPDGFPWLEE